MNIFQALILGIVQGLTEFLPVSSSGHLVIFEHLLNTTLEDINFDVFAHAGTLLAVLVFYRVDLIRIMGNFLQNPFSFRNNDRGEADKKEFPGYWVWLIIIGTIPAGVLGILLEDYITLAFKSVNLVGFVLIGCGIILLSTRFIPKKRRKISIIDAILIGFAQALAMTPGLSRSGMTISMGLFRGVDPVK
ncbi:MAG: undecaprenyl-diphosphatase, partial [candidate division Zixibacteria bacterium]|nr:undecaprenyl-diphosphatase [candidate division Zixibacteria bacterium]